VGSFVSYPAKILAGRGLFVGDRQMNNNVFINFFKKRWKVLTFFFVLICIIYANSLNNEFVSDDIIGIQNNAKINTLGYVFLPPYSYLRQFLVFLTHKVFGLEPIFYRLPNLFFHFGSTVLLPRWPLSFFPNQARQQWRPNIGACCHRRVLFLLI